MTRIEGGLAWSLANNSWFKISKLAMLHASQCTQQDPENPRKRISLDWPPLWLQDKMIKEVESYKYLGVYIDLQLRWNIQAQKGVANTTSWVMQFHRLMRISTGISVKLMRQLYIVVAIPKMTYAINVWYTPPTKQVGQRRSTGSVRVLHQMTKLQRLASLAIVGGMKSTPTDLLDVHAGLLPVELMLLCICHGAMVKLCTLPDTHPLHPLVQASHRSWNKKHRDPIKNALRIFKLDPRKFEPIAPDLTPPPSSLSCIIPVISEDHEESILVESGDTSDYRIYTDGSGYEGKTGASAVLYKNGEPHTSHLLSFHLGDITQHSQRCWNGWHTASCMAHMYHPRFCPALFQHTYLLTTSL